MVAEPAGSAPLIPNPAIEQNHNIISTSNIQLVFSSQKRVLEIDPSEISPPNSYRCVTSLSVNYKNTTYIRRSQLVFIIEPTATCFGFLTKPDQAVQELQIIVMWCTTLQSKPL